MKIFLGRHVLSQSLHMRSFRKMCHKPTAYRAQSEPGRTPLARTPKMKENSKFRVKFGCAPETRPEICEIYPKI